jgi:spore germination protein
MGIPNYGYDWPLPFEQGVTMAKSIGNEEAIRIAERYGAEIKYDETSASPFFNYYDENGREHEVWFEDVRSIARKYELIDEFSLKGSGYWNLMRSFSQNWSYVNSRYNIVKQ